MVAEKCDNIKNFGSAAWNLQPDHTGFDSWSGYGFFGLDFFFDWRWSTGIFSLPITFWAEFGLYNRCDFTVKTRWSNSLSLTMKWLPCKLNGESLHCVWKVLTLILFDEKYCNVHIEMFWKIIPNQSFSGFSSINPFQTESFFCSNWTLFKLDKFFIKKVYKCF